MTRARTARSGESPWRSRTRRDSSWEVPVAGASNEAFANFVDACACWGKPLPGRRGCDCLEASCATWQAWRPSGRLASRTTPWTSRVRAAATARSTATAWLFAEGDSRAANDTATFRGIARREDEHKFEDRRGEIPASHATTRLAPSVPARMAAPSAVRRPNEHERRTRRRSALGPRRRLVRSWDSGQPIPGSGRERSRCDRASDTPSRGGGPATPHPTRRTRVGACVETRPGTNVRDCPPRASRAVTRVGGA